MTDFIVKSPKRQGKDQTIKLTVNETTREIDLGAVVALTAAEVAALNDGGYNPCELNSAGFPAGIDLATGLSDDAKDPAPTILTIPAIAAAATTVAVTHDIPVSADDLGNLILYRDRAGTITAQDTEVAAASPQTMDFAAALEDDRYWVEATYGGSAVKVSNIITASA